jgi:hypothetical protein
LLSACRLLHASSAAAFSASEAYTRSPTKKEASCRRALWGKGVRGQGSVTGVCKRGTGRGS